MNLKDRYNVIVNEVFRLDGASVNEDMARTNTAIWDSVLHITFITRIEDAFDIMLETEDILNLQSYKDGLAIISRYLNEEQ